MKHIALATLLAFTFSNCDKNKKKIEPEQPAPPVQNEQEVITTLRIYLWDSITNAEISGSPFSFKDPDGEGGQAGAFLNNGADSVINLSANTTYKTRIVILDETKNPVDSISNEVEEESYEHMIFYNGNLDEASGNRGNTILHAGYPNYTVKLNGSDIRIRYIDKDNGAEHGKQTRNIGLETYLKTSNATSGKFPFIITLKHQPDEKDGTYSPGETDVMVEFKVKVN
ncbi:MAG: hypothetical protein KF900_03925 [Bacteroidetes bacterium]|nr:hypothetical protein [Bacteroidota bacterium]